MAHSKMLGDVKMPIGTYEVNEGGQKRTKRRHREIGSAFEMTYDGGHTGIVVKLNIEILSIEMQALLRANGLINKGDDAILCNVYSREPRAQGAASQPEAEPEESDKVPF